LITRTGPEPMRCPMLRPSTNTLERAFSEKRWI
jgi:hypothetical protein